MTQLRRIFSRAKQGRHRPERRVCASVPAGDMRSDHTLMVRLSGIPFGTPVILPVGSDAEWTIPVEQLDTELAEPVIFDQTVDELGYPAEPELIAAGAES